MKHTWRYANKGNSKKKHAFVTPSSAISVCGYHLPWYSDKDWKVDEEGLEKRSKCGRCTYLLKVATHTAQPHDHPNPTGYPGRRGQPTAS